MTVCRTYSFVKKSAISFPYPYETLRKIFFHRNLTSCNSGVAQKCFLLSVYFCSRSIQVIYSVTKVVGMVSLRSGSGLC